MQPCSARIRNATAISKFDAIIAGSGINSLVCAAVLAKLGRKFCRLERKAVLGGRIRTEALTAPGYLHDSLSSAVDLSRARAGGSVLWVQLPECPRRILGDAFGEAYADRIVARMARQMPNLAPSIGGRKVLSPGDLEKNEL